MSDISEHDSDSDTETEKLKQISSKKETSAAAAAVTTTVGETADSSNITENSSSTNIVEELKQQANATETASASEEQPDWVKYLEQNSDTGAYTYTDQTDGTVYEWDATKKGWIPKIDDDFIAMYQANYGFTATGEHDPNIHQHAEDLEEKEEDKKAAAAKSAAPEAGGQKPKDGGKKDDAKGTKRKKEEEKREWFDIEDRENNNVYVSGLPTTITNDEFVELMMKYGIIMEDDTGTMKIKLYRVMYCSIIMIISFDHSCCCPLKIQCK